MEKVIIFEEVSNRELETRVNNFLCEHSDDVIIKDIQYQTAFNGRAIHHHAMIRYEENS